MKLYQLLFERIVAAQGGRFGNLAWRLHQLALRWHDPLVIYQIRDWELRVRFSSMVPIIMARYPHYGQNLVRLAAFLRGDFGRISSIDIGANVGDTFLQIVEPSDELHLLIDGDPEMVALLRENSRPFANSIAVEAILSDAMVTVPLTMAAHGGNARLQTTSIATTQLQTLDQLVAIYTPDATFDLLKVDVEGYDARVLRGAREVILRDRPIIFAEFNAAMLADVDGDEFVLLQTLTDYDYRHIVLYDNFGYLVGVIDSLNEPFLHDLWAYAAAQHRYFDLCAFPTECEDQFARFIAAERAHIAKLSVW